MRLGHSASRLGSRARIVLIGTCAVMVALVAIAFAVGGGSGSGSTAGATRGVASDLRYDSLGVPGVPVPSSAPMDKAAEPLVAAAPGLAPLAPDSAEMSQSAPYAGAGTSASGGVASGGGGSSARDSAKIVHSGFSLDATRIIKTGNLTIRVPKLGVTEATQKLVSLAAAQGGYVSGSNASLDGPSQYSEVVLRIPVAHFQDTIDAAAKLGKQISLTTSADDVTGKFVDLSAKKHALERTRSTYLTILSRARTIGETLAVQQRVDDVQQQIDQLHGQLKLIGNQASYSTLTVDVVTTAVHPLITKHHDRHGISKAWHDSWSRFGRGVNAIVGAIGPIVFAILLLGLFALIGLLGYRGFRRFGRATS